MAKRSRKVVGRRARKAMKAVKKTARARIAAGVLNKGAAARPAEQAEAAQQVQRLPSDFEDYLVDSLATDRSGGLYKDISAFDMIYCLTASGRQLGYKSGFVVGNSLYEKSNNDIEMLFKTLRMFGLGRVLYYPAEDRAIITANEKTRSYVVLNDNIHVYECGIIAGFLSAATGQNISVVETHCIYNDSSFCQFVADPMPQEERKEHRLDQNAFVRTIATLIDGQPSGVVDSQTEHGYFILPMLPLMRQPLAEETGKVLYLIGVNLAQISKRENPEEVIQKIGYALDLKGVSIERSGNSKRVIRLKYKHYNSLDQLVNLSVALFVGFLTTAFNSRPELEMFNDLDKGYVVKIKVKWSVDGAKP
jgi:predicted hydrocarbon binding protein